MATHPAPVRTVILVLAMLAGPVGADEPAGPPDVASMEPRALATLLRTEPPTPELTQAILRARSRPQRTSILSIATSEMVGPEALNVAAHAVALGVLSRDVLEAVGFLANSEVALLGPLRRITHPDLHVYVVELDVRKVLTGRLELTPANTPLRVPVSAMFDHARWIAMDPAPGTEFVLFARHRDVLYEKRRLLVRALAAWGGHAWPATGREADVVRLLEPLGWKDPAAIAEGMRSTDARVRWLAVVRACQACRDLGSPFEGAWSRGRFHLDSEALEHVRAEVLSRFEEIEPRLTWDDEGAAFLLDADPK